MIFRWCFWSAHDVNNKVHCSESSHFYNRFLRFCYSDEVWKPLKNIWKTMWTFTFRRHPKSTPKIMKKYLPNHSKINKKSMLEAIRDWVQFFLHLGAVLNRSFNDFSSKIGPKIDPQINKKSIPRPPGLSEGPQDGPRSLQDSILDWLSMIFRPILEEFWHDFHYNFGAIFK